MDREEGWKTGRLVWVERRPSPAGRDSFNVIYELDDEPDILREADLSEADLAPGVRRRDPILVDDRGASIVIRKPSSEEE